MRIACICKNGTANAYYRAVLPMAELRRRGHTIVERSAEALRLKSGPAPDFDLLHLQQVAEPADPAMIERMRAAGVAVVWDSDDDALDMPKFIPAYKRLGGRRGVKRHAERCADLGRRAHLMTTPSGVLAQTYRETGAEHVAVIENYIADADLKKARRPHRGVVIGCTAAMEHQTDVERLRLRDILRRLLEKHEEVQLVTIGVDFGLTGSRYVNYPRIAIEELVKYESVFDIGIAPLVDSRFNRARSNVKLKEYAAAGAMWLASPVGPYLGLGEDQGGWLVEDREWFDALDEAVTNASLRRTLAARGAAWARRQTIKGNASLWERAFRDAIARARAEAGIAAGAGERR
jgi:hypothetical protein